MDLLPTEAFADPLDGVEHHLGGVLELKFFLDAIAEGMNRGNGKVQLFRNLAGRFALAHHLENLQLSIA